jgi:hypothetical protein
MDDALTAKTPLQPLERIVESLDKELKDEQHVRGIESVNLECIGIILGNYLILYKKILKASIRVRENQMRYLNTSVANNFKNVL